MSEWERVGESRRERDERSDGHLVCNKKWVSMSSFLHYMHLKIALFYTTTAGLTHARPTDAAKRERAGVCKSGLMPSKKCYVVSTWKSTWILLRK